MSLSFDLQKVLDESSRPTDEKMIDEFDQSNEDYTDAKEDYDIEVEAKELAIKNDRDSHFLKTNETQKISNFGISAANNNADNNSLSRSNSINNLKAAGSKKSLDLAQLFKSPVIVPVDRAPIDANSYKGKMAILAQRDRDAKTKAKDLCINKISPISAHLEHWQVSFSPILKSYLFTQNINYHVK